MDEEINRFRQSVWECYRQHGRHELPWRRALPSGGLDPYAVLVSEVMLQQTQVPRVVPKFESFMLAFPNAEALAAASLGDVLRAWSGLGYNRRAKFLWLAAQTIVSGHAGRLPGAYRELIALPGVGPNTAGAILAYAFNQPAVFIETNIRTVFIQHFFDGQAQVRDADILALSERALAGADNPRVWYWALMDYGTYLKQTVGNAARASAGYGRQSKFEGSRRQVRGRILRELARTPETEYALAGAIGDPRLGDVLADLLHEGLVEYDGGSYKLS